MHILKALHSPRLLPECSSTADIETSERVPTNTTKLKSILFFGEIKSEPICTWLKFDRLNCNDHTLLHIKIRYVILKDVNYSVYANDLNKLMHHLTLTHHH